MYRRYFTIDMVNGSGRVDKEFDTYEEAYRYMCLNYVREMNEGYKPTLFKIMQHDVTIYNGTTNIMIQPVWGP